uniref:Uncharacterized protein n=1 Tax=Candidatus Kentrum sp. LPFa TaxID=2126335 RepID=A0A450X6P1_9GAMM|nr:MAG: hypothetical protein BECKLPF1236B_GA0070989_14422 [Candidatus Kentron sp. LPFa]
MIRYRKNPNLAKPEPKIFVHYSPVIPLISGNPVTNISLIFLDRFVEDFPDNGLRKTGADTEAYPLSALARSANMFSLSLGITTRRSGFG